jgi:hypothetical protein
VIVVFSFAFKNAFAVCFSLFRDGGIPLWRRKYMVFAIKPGSSRHQSMPFWGEKCHG